jgi:Lon protease-like protein
MIGMVLLRPGFEADYDGAPPVYATGCSGLITHSEQLADGRYNLVLRGVEKFSITGEDAPAPGRLYRSAVVAPVEEFLADSERDELRRQRKVLEAQLTPLLNGALDNHLPPAMPDEDLVNTLAQYLEFEPIEKLALLEQQGALARCRTLVELLEMKAMASGPGEGSVH